MGIFIVLSLVFLILWLREKKKSSAMDSQLSSVKDDLDNANRSIEELSKYQACVDAEKEAVKIHADAMVEASNIVSEAKELSSKTTNQASAMKRLAEQKLLDAKDEAASIRKKANQTLLDAQHEKTLRNTAKQLRQ